MPRVLNFKIDGLPEGAVYIGRAMPRYRLRKSKWHNPYLTGTREQMIANYKAHLYEDGLINDIGELRGKDLVCWCAPLRCHGDILLRLANET
jgi:hypothetical protein